MERVTKFAGVLFVVVWTGTSVPAAILELTYTGFELEDQIGNAPLGLGPTLQPLSGKVVIDEDAFGGSVAGKTVEFFAKDDFTIPFDPPFPDGVLDWTLGIPLFSTGGTEVQLTFDASRNVTGWLIDALDGPPDYFSTPSGDFYFNSDDVNYEAPPGSWRTQVIPVPATLPLALAGVAALAALARRRCDCE